MCLHRAGELWQCWRRHAGLHTEHAESFKTGGANRDVDMQVSDCDSEVVSTFSQLTVGV